MQAEEYTYKTWAKRDSKPSSGFYVAIINSNLDQI